MKDYDDIDFDADDDVTPHRRYDNPDSEPREESQTPSFGHSSYYDDPVVSTPRHRYEDVKEEPEEEDEDEERDYFNDDDPVEPAPKKPKPPKYKSDDPRYWEKESRWEHLKPRRRTRFYLWLIFSAVIIGGMVAGYLRYFSPYIEGATQYGYVEDIQFEGAVFKTFEGTLIPYKELMDTTRIYQRDFVFTAENDKVATELKRAMIARKPVRVEYKRYFGTLPWRGASRTIITYVDTVNPRTILPPEFNGDKLP